MIVAGLITAGGRGQRMGATLPKQFLELDGISILSMTLSVFGRHPLIHRIVVTLPSEQADFCRQHTVSEFDTEKTISIAPGGPTRQESVYNGLEMLSDTDVVVIHDGVRPFVTPDVITRTIQAALEVGAAVAAVPVRETVKRKTKEMLETLARENLWFAHTPQSFQTSLILRAHQEARSVHFHGTDDAVLVERLGHPVAIVTDSYDNMKITTPFDLAIASILARNKFGSKIGSQGI